MYTGGYAETNFRHPDLLTELAPREYQEACLRAGGRNIYCQPNFRLAVLQTRFQLMGGFRMSFYDQRGYFHRRETCEVLVPRYRTKEGFEDSFVLEVWRSPAWYASQGFGVESRIYDYSAAGQQIQRMESIPPCGGYEGVIWDADIPWCFTPWRHIITVDGKHLVQERVQPLTIEKAIHTWINALDMTGKDRAALRTANDQRGESINSREIIDRICDKPTIFDLQPGMSMCGVTAAQRTGQELWRQEQHRQETN